MTMYRAVRIIRAPGIVRHYWSAVLGILWLGAVSVPARAQSAAFPLERGVNVLGWYSSTTAAATSPPSDYPLVARLGFTFVRLPINPEILGADGDQLDAGAVARLDTVLTQVQAAGLGAIVDIHPKDPFKRRLFLKTAAGARFVRFWKALATHIARRHSPRSVAFELLNEPFEPHRALATTWNQLEHRVWQAVRAVAPNYLIVLSGAEWSHIDALRDVQVIHDSNAVYTVHFYYPETFTYQGANWGSHATKPVVLLRGIPFPPTGSGIDSAIQQLRAAGGGGGLPDQAIAALQTYQSGDVDSDIVKRFATAAVWAHQQHVRLFVGEFGVYNRWAPKPSRARWLRDVRVAIESQNLPWALYSLRGGFGIVDADGRVDPSVLAALGLPGPP